MRFCGARKHWEKERSSDVHCQDRLLIAAVMWHEDCQAKHGRMSCVRV